MNANEYQAAAMRTASGQSKEDLILNGVLGLNGEAGEVADIIKKARFQGHDMDDKKIVDELGDVLWYIAIMAEGIGVSLSEVMYHNVKKLKKRYPAGFEAEKSINRVE